MTYTVPYHHIPLLAEPPFVAMLALLAVAIGLRFLELIGSPLQTVSRLDKLILAGGVGFGALQIAPFLLGLLGLLRPSAIWAALAVQVCLTWRECLQVLRSGWKALRELPTHQHRWLYLGLFCVVATVLFIPFLESLCPPAEGDSVGYHLVGPKRWLQAGRIEFLPTITSTSRTLGFEMLYTICMAVWSDSSAKLLHFCVGLFTIVAVFAVSRRFSSTSVAAGVVLLWLSGTFPQMSPIYLFGWAYVDLAVTFELIVAVFAWLLWYRLRDRTWLICSAVCAGIGVTFKLTGIFYGIILGAQTLFAHDRDRGTEDETGGNRFKLALTYVVIFLLPVVPWLIRNWCDTGNPVYPALSSVFPTRDWTRADAIRLDAYYKYYVWGKFLGPYWTLERRAVLRWIVIASLGVLAIVVQRKTKSISTRVLAITSIAGMICGIWLTGFQYRLLLPAFTLAILSAGTWFGAARERTHFLQAAGCVLLFLSAGKYVRSSIMNVPSFARGATGMIDRNSFVFGHEGLFKAWNLANLVVPRGQTILADGIDDAVGVPYGGSYYSDNPVMSTGLEQGRFHVDSWDRYLSEIRSSRIQYALIVDNPPSWRRQSTDRLLMNEQPFAGRLAAEYGLPLAKSGGLTLYKLDYTPTAKRP